MNYFLISLKWLPDLSQYYLAVNQTSHKKMKMKRLLRAIQIINNNKNFYFFKKHDTIIDTSFKTIVVTIK